MQLVLFVAKEEKQVGLLQAHWSEFVASLTLMLKAQEKECDEMKKETEA